MVRTHVSTFTELLRNRTVMEEGRAKFIDWYPQNYGIVNRPLSSDTAATEPSRGRFPSINPGRCSYSRKLWLHQLTGKRICAQGGSSATKGITL
jgi:hypothetical protein